jgi:hypothetical protein
MSVTRKSQLMDPPPVTPRIDWRKLAKEFVVAFVGVLMALAANAAWTRQQEARREAALIAVLQDDLGGYRGVIKGLVALEDSAMHADTMLLSMMRGGRPIIVDSLRYWVHPLLWSANPVAPGMGLVLTQTGDATMLRDPMLRARIAQYVTSTSSRSAELGRLTDQHLEEVGRMFLLIEPFATSEGPNRTVDRLARALPALRSSAELRTSLAMIASIRNNRLTLLRDLQSDADSLAAVLRARR